MLPSLSIIIPAYNAEKYIDRCLQSIFRKDIDGCNLEVIVINDASTDLTGDRVQKFSHQILYVNREFRGGVSAARNDGLKIASGEYVFFVDADDTIDLDSLEETLKFAQSADIVSFGYCIDFLDECDEVVSSEQRISPWHGRGYTCDVYGTLFTSIIGIGLNDLVRWSCGGRLKENKLQGFSWCYLFRRNIIVDNNIKFDTRLRYNEDAIFNANVFRKAGSVVFLDFVVYHYSKRNLTGASYTVASNAVEMSENKLQLLAAKREIYEDEFSCGRDILELFCGSNILSIVEVACLSSNCKGGYRIFRKYLRDPLVRRSVDMVSIRGKRMELAGLLIVLKLHMSGLLFLAAKFLHIVGVDVRAFLLKTTR